MRWPAMVWLLLLACAPVSPPEEPERTPERDTTGQSYAEAIATICAGNRLSGADASDPLSAPAKRDDYLVEHVKNPDGIYFLTVFRTRPADEQAELLTQEASRAKLAHCALVDDLKAEAK
jgi:hypothetical protein